MSGEEKFLADQFGGEEARRLIGKVIGREIFRTFRKPPNYRLQELFHAFTFRGGDGQIFLKWIVLLVFGELRKQIMFGRERIDLVHGENYGRAAFAENAEGAFVFFREGMGGIDYVDEEIALFKGVAYRVHHALVDGAGRSVNTWGIHKNYLGIGTSKNALNGGARSLRFIRDDGDFLSNERIQQSRFARVGAPEYGNEA